MASTTNHVLGAKSRRWGYISDLNSTTTSLSANSEYQGTFEQVQDYAGAFVYLRSDAPGTLYFDQSPDAGVTVAYTNTQSFVIDANSTTTKEFKLFCEHVRVRFETTVAQSAFVLTTKFHHVQQDIDTVDNSSDLDAIFLELRTLNSSTQELIELNKQRNFLLERFF